MKRLVRLLTVALVLILVFALPASALTVEAKSAVLIDANTGRVIFQQNEHEALAPASTTKMLTALLVLENVEDLDQLITLPNDFANVGESSVYLEPGDKRSYRDLLYCLMLRSANDAAQALAIGVAGTEADFVTMMNERSVELGLADSSWENPHGLDGDNHLTSAYDLAMIAREAAKYELFNTITSTKSYTLEWENYPYDKIIYNHNQFIDLYTGADGIKTGYTNKSGSCLVGSATQGGLRLIGVVLNSEDHYGDMEKLMEFGFNRYEAMELGKAGDVVGNIRVINGDIDRVDVLLGSDVSIAVELDSNFTPTPKYDFPAALEAPFSADIPVGTVTYKDSQGNSTTVDLYASAAAERYTFGIVFAEIWRAFLSVFSGKK